VFIFDDGTGNADTDSDTEQPETADTPPDALDMAEIISSGVDQAALTGQSAANAGVDEYEYEYGED
jgi:hypothetical protein